MFLARVFVASCPLLAPSDKGSVGAAHAHKTVAGKGGSAAWWSRQSLEHIEGAGAARAA